MRTTTIACDVCGATYTHDAIDGPAESDHKGPQWQKLDLKVDGPRIGGERLGQRYDVCTPVCAEHLLRTKLVAMLLEDHHTAVHRTTYSLHDRLHGRSQSRQEAADPKGDRS